jgi:quercetin dioxygenase-like cupin family protein
MRLTRWKKETVPSLQSLRTTLAGQGYQVSEWADLPGTVYPVHSHEYAEVRWVVRGKLRIGIPENGEEITLEAGDRLELDPHIPYWADVEDGQPVMYLVGIKNHINKPVPINAPDPTAHRRATPHSAGRKRKSLAR